MFCEDGEGAAVILEVGNDHAIVQHEALGACRELGEEPLRGEGLLHRPVERRDAGEQISEGRFCRLGQSSPCRSL
jgi:hypothetical protein